ncbi:MAG: hypothetical protein LQ348_003545 [Seirophora lacunosa]|nr:MAG: hypothetical protein LQ348_003545 [Seirophora lacunosa]
MPLPKNASDDCLHRNNCHKAFRTSPPRAWEFLYYIPNEHHPIKDDEGCSAHFCLVLPDDYKRAVQRSNPFYRAVALITRRPRSITKSQGCMLFRPHTANCTCPRRSGELETSVVNRESEAGPKAIVNACSTYSRTDTKNRGHFETWSWYDDSVIPVQVPKLVHVECLHLIRSLTQSKFGVTLLSRSVLVFEKAFERFKETSGATGTIKMVPTNQPVSRPIQARNTVVGTGAPLVVSQGIGVL